MKGYQMSEAVGMTTVDNDIHKTAKDKSCLLGVMRLYMDRLEVDTSQPILVLGGEQEDEDILTMCGFKHIVLSNLETVGMSLDAENIALPDNSYAVVFAHAVLHHCRCPQKAVGEMVRVSRDHVFFVEPNDSLALRLLSKLGFSFPFELAAVAAHDYVHGGMRDGPIPNFIFRWSQREVGKCVAAYHPERSVDVCAHPYWDFYVNEYELLNRKESRVAELARRVGPRNLIRLLHLAQSALNSLLPLRVQGNKFFCAISKRGLHPWIESHGGGFRLRKTPVHPPLSKG
jgi:hypothetical protein